MRDRETINKVRVSSAWTHSAGRAIRSRMETEWSVAEAPTATRRRERRAVTTYRTCPIRPDAADCDQLSRSIPLIRAPACQRAAANVAPVDYCTYTYANYAINITHVSPDMNYLAAFQM